MKIANDDDIQPRSKNNRWIFRKDVSIGNIISMIGLFIGLFAWGNAIDRRLVTLEERVAVNVITNDRQDQALKDAVAERNQKLNRIEDKLDYALDSIRVAGTPIPYSQRPQRIPEPTATSTPESNPGSNSVKNTTRAKGAR